MLQPINPASREPELVDPVTEAMKRLTNPKAKAARAPRQTVELFVELGDFAYRRGRDLRAGSPRFLR